MNTNFVVTRSAHCPLTNKVVRDGFTGIRKEDIDHGNYKVFANEVFENVVPLGDRINMVLKTANKKARIHRRRLTPPSTETSTRFKHRWHSLPIVK